MERQGFVIRCKDCREFYADLSTPSKVGRISRAEIYSKDMITALRQDNLLQRNMEVWEVLIGRRTDLECKVE